MIYLKPEILAIIHLPWGSEDDEKSMFREAENYGRTNYVINTSSAGIIPYKSPRQNYSTQISW